MTESRAALSGRSIPIATRSYERTLARNSRYPSSVRSSKLEAQEGRHITGLATGFYELDEMTSGMQPGEMVIIAARPSMGKTAFALNLAEHMGADQNHPVGIFSLEMGKQQLAQRLLCSRSGVDSHRLRRNMLNAEDFQRLSLAVGELDELSDWVADLEPDGEGIPVLLRQYLKLGGRIAAFNVDPDFSNVLDVLIMVDLRRTDKKILGRYMGREGRDRFLDCHPGGDEPGEVRAG